jgi:hypothetical protein
LHFICFLFAFYLLFIFISFVLPFSEASHRLRYTNICRFACTLVWARRTLEQARPVKRFPATNLQPQFALTSHSGITIKLSRIPTYFLGKFLDFHCSNLNTVTSPRLLIIYFPRSL